MTKPEFAAIDRLLGDILDDRPSPPEMEKTISELQSLLLNRPDLQEHYVRLVELNGILEHDLSTNPAGANPLEIIPGLVASEFPAGHRQSLFEPSAPPTGHSIFGRQAMLVTAVGLLVTFAASAYTSRIMSSLQMDSEPISLHAPENDSERVHELTVHDETTLVALTQASRTASISALTLMGRRSLHSSEVTLCSGTAWMHRDDEPMERGYVVALRPGFGMDVFVTSNAGLFNSLTVLELDKWGRVAGPKASFTNVELNGKTAPSHQAIGTFAHYPLKNESQSMRYFLFAGAHIVDGGSPESTCHQSDFKLKFDEKGILVIGFDDKGFGERSEATQNSLIPDDDYDDIQANIRFFRIGGEEGPVLGKPKSLYFPKPQLPLLTADGEESGDILTVAPGEELLISISSSTFVPTAFEVIDATSRKILWQQKKDHPNDAVRRCTVDGTFLIQNHENNARRYEIRCSYADSPDINTANWITSHRMKYPGQSKTLAILCLHKSKDISYKWVGVHVHAQWFDMSK